MISTTGLSIGYRKGKSTNVVQTDLDLNATKGSLVATLGPNGCGKSTLLRTLAGILDPLEGTVQVQGSRLSTLTLLERAKYMSLVLTDSIQVVYMTVRDLVAMGRHPYTTLFGQLTDHDIACVDKALETWMTAFADRYVQELSDSERQRVMIAKALARIRPWCCSTSLLPISTCRIETILLLRNDQCGVRPSLLSTPESTWPCVWPTACNGSKWGNGGCTC